MQRGNHPGSFPVSRQLAGKGRSEGKKLLVNCIPSSPGAAGGGKLCIYFFTLLQGSRGGSFSQLKASFP